MYTTINDTETMHIYLNTTAEFKVTTDTISLYILWRYLSALMKSLTTKNVSEVQGESSVCTD